MILPIFLQKNNENFFYRFEPIVRVSVEALALEFEALGLETRTRSIVPRTRFELVSKAREALILDRARRPGR